MKKSRFWFGLIFCLSFGMVGCTQVAPAPVGTQVTDLVVSTLVAHTLTALAPTISPTQTPLLPTGTALSTRIEPVVLPTLTLTLQPAVILSPTPTASVMATTTPTPSPTPAASASPTPIAIVTATPVATQSATSTTTAVQPNPTTTTAAQPNPTATTVPPPNPTATAISAIGASQVTVDCVDKAAFVADVTIPDETVLLVKSAFTKTWRIKNVGTCTWGAGYSLVFARGNILGGPPTVALPGAVPGGLVDVSVNLVVPAQGGTYAGDWQFQNPTGKRFGVNSHGEDFIFVIIKADWGPGVGPTATPPPQNCAYDRRSDYESVLLRLINQARAANGVAPLTLQSQLTAAALGHSADMACNNYLDHSGSDKSTHASRVRAQGYLAKSESENIFAGGDAQVAYDWWMGSPVHRQNILDQTMTQIGIACVNYSMSKFGLYYTLNFARP